MPQNSSQLHQQPHMNATRLNTTADTTVSMQDDSDEMQEVIEVQILPQVGPDLFHYNDKKYEYFDMTINFSDFDLNAKNLFN